MLWEFVTWLILRLSILSKLDHLVLISQMRRCSVEKLSLKISQKATEKNLYLSLRFNIVAGLRPATVLKKDSVADVFLWILRNFYESPFVEHFRWLLLKTISKFCFVQTCKYYEVIQILFCYCNFTLKLQNLMSTFRQTCSVTKINKRSPLISRDIWKKYLHLHCLPAGIYLFKVNNENMKTSVPS